MDDLIYRDEVLKKVTEYCCESCDLGEVVDSPCEGCLVMDAATKIKNAPTVDAVPVRHGRWKVIYSDNTLPTVGECSECGSIRRISNYCPNCGAKMDRKKERTDE